MRKKFLSLTLIIMMMFLSSSCNLVKNDNATIQIWWYKYSYTSYADKLDNVLGQLMMYCRNENIPIEIVKYDDNTLSYDDYILKRNVAMASGNMITIDDASNFHEIGKHHADYSKVENYNKLFDVYKDRSSVPMGIGYLSNAINNEVLEYYGINTNRKVITYNDYLDIKQQIREKGGDFRLNKAEYSQMLDYYLIKNGLGYINEDSEIIKDKEKFKEAVKKATIEMYESFKLYYADCDNLDFTDRKIRSVNVNDNVIYDENSELELMNFHMKSAADCRDISLSDQILEKTFVISHFTSESPCIYMHKKITNEKIYNVFNKLLDDSYYITVIERNHYYTPAQNTDKIREFFQVDENWNYNGDFIALAKDGDEYYKGLVKLMNETHELLLKMKKR